MDILIACTQFVLYMVVGILQMMIIPIAVFAGFLLIVFLIKENN